MKFGKKVIFLALVLFAAGGLIWFILASRGNEQTPPGVKNDSLLGLSLQDYDGKEIRLDNFLGRPLLVAAWASWCHFCASQMLQLTILQEERKDQLTVILINRAEPQEQAKRFSDQAGITGRITILLDQTDAFYKTIGGFSMPEIIFLNKEGNIIRHKRGLINSEEMKRMIQESFAF